MCGLYDRGARSTPARNDAGGHDRELRGAHVGFPDAGPRRRPDRATDQGGLTVETRPDPAHDVGCPGRTGHGVRHVRRVLDRLALVPLRRLLVRLHHHDLDQDRSVRGLRAAHGGGRGREHLARAPAPAAAERDVDGAAEPRPLPDEHRPVQEVGAPRDHRPGRADRRSLRLRSVAHVADVGQRRLLRTEGPAVPPGRVVLRVRPALVPLPARLRLRRHHPGPGRRRADALPVRRAARHQPRRACDGRGHRPSVGAAGPLRLAEGRGVLARPVRPRGEVQRLQGGGQLDGPALRRRERVPAA